MFAKSVHNTLSFCIWNFNCIFTGIAKIRVPIFFCILFLFFQNKFKCSIIFYASLWSRLTYMTKNIIFCIWNKNIYVLTGNTKLPHNFGILVKPPRPAPLPPFGQCPKGRRFSFWMSSLIGKPLLSVYYTVWLSPLYDMTCILYLPLTNIGPPIRTMVINPPSSIATTIQPD